MELKKITAVLFLLLFAAFSYWYNEHSNHVQEPQAMMQPEK